MPDAACGEYSNTFYRPGCLNHAFVVGLADPTHELPSGSVFVTGFYHQYSPLNDIFVTRSPYIEPSDGRMVPLITKKPGGMSQQSWDWLLTLLFGGIIFANSEPDEIPLPEIIASGDLDVSE